MGFRVNNHTLLFIAGLVWLIAGINVLRIGITTWTNAEQCWLFKIGETTAIFLLFFVFIFKRLFHKHTKRIEEKKEKSSPFSFFDKKGWIIMCFMITLGVVIRKFQLLPNTFISVFYTGLSSALIITGLLFLRQAWIKKP